MGFDITEQLDYAYSLWKQEVLTKLELLVKWSADDDVISVVRIKNIINNKYE
jgi:hypothetical protein